MLKAPDLRPPGEGAVQPAAAGRQARIADPRNARAAAGAPLFTSAPRRAGEGNADLWAVLGRWGPAQRPASPRRRRPQPTGWLPSRPNRTPPSRPISPRGGGSRRAPKDSSMRYPSRAGRRATERRSPTGIARERETCTNDAGPSQRQSRTAQPPAFTPAPRPNTVAPNACAPRPNTANGSKSWSAGLRPASRGSAKPAPTTPAPANVSPAPPHAVGVNGPTRSCGFLPVEASGRNRPPEAGEGLAFHPHVGRTPGEPHGPAPSYQISPTVKPSGKGSDGSTEYWAIPVIQAVPLIVGTTAGTPPTVVVPIRRPTNSVPTGPK